LRKQQKIMKSTLQSYLFIPAILLSTSVSLVAQSTVYDNTANPQTSGGNQLFYSPTLTTAEFGDQITLAGTDRTLRQFSFSYYYSGGASDQPTATIRFYNGDPTTAGGTFFVSDTITLATRSAAGYGSETIDFSAATSAINLPNTFTWTIQFSNLGANQGGLLFFGPPTVGSSFNDFWENSGSWQTMVSTTPQFNDFAARVTAVPEPGVLALGALALLARFGFARCRKSR
jgi:hypothetical protein